ncbi:MAG TPA: hypothetical protein VNS12_03385 [Pelagibacterium sp.]|uniref:hypothetical protein n=1 Tax=Pelagibacterium sp. TaxID=1967288 RepID=UPI002C2D4607|nr:hypothetical protein [Pelagibacterium sp.]HWJ87098.1 hypothetical protein [Pelagibacterium sp.]
MKQGWLDKIPLWFSPRMMSWAILAFFALALLTILFPDRPWPARSAIFPIGIVSVALVLSAMEIAIAKIPYLNARFAPTGVLDLGLPEDVDETKVVGRSNAAILWLVFIVVGFAIVGFQVTVVLFTATYLRVMAKAPLLTTVIYTAVTWLAIFVGIESMISIPWPKPLIMQFVGL